MNAPLAFAVLKQHLIDPEICIRCNTCEDTCPIKAISHDSRNYVVDASKCESCLACVAPCPTGAIDNWRMVPRAQPFTLAQQLSWDDLPAEQPLVGEPALAANVVGTAAATSTVAAPALEVQPVMDQTLSASVPPWSAAHPYLHTD